MKNCKHCGTELEDGSSICPVCGKLLNDLPEILQEIDVKASEADELFGIDNSEKSIASEALAAESRPFVSDSITESVRAELLNSIKKRKKAKRRKALISVLAALIIAAAVACIIIFTSPKYKLISAFERSMGEINDIYASCENLINVENVSDSILESGQFSTEMDLNGTLSPLFLGTYPYEDIDSLSEYLDYLSGSYSFGSSFRLDYDLQRKCLEGSCDMSTEANGEVSSLSAAFSANEGKTMFRFSDLPDKTYCFSNETLGKDLADSALYSSINTFFTSKSNLREVRFEPFAIEKNDERRQQIEDELRTFLKSVEISKSDSKICGFNGDVYRISFDSKDLKLLVKRCIVITNNGKEDILYYPQVRNLLNDIRSAEYRVYAGIKDGKLAAISVQINYGEKISIVLHGSDNIWNDFSIYTDDEEIAYGGICTTENGMEFKAKATGFNASLLFEINDEDKELNLTVSAQRVKCELLKMNYSEDSGAISLSIKLMPDVIFMTGLKELSFDISLSPLKTTPAMLSDNAVDIFALVDSEIEALFDELDQKLFGAAFYDDESQVS
ncbi:MAG: zinc-ribbon domain-containing protein [Bacillota bacterium]|nr:zinc-ribbon domain-containing protein [Bacillota bacterium]